MLEPPYPLFALCSVKQGAIEQGIVTLNEVFLIHARIVQISQTDEILGKSHQECAFIIDRSHANLGVGPPSWTSEATLISSSARILTYSALLLVTVA